MLNHCLESYRWVINLYTTAEIVLEIGRMIVHVCAAIYHNVRVFVLVHIETDMDSYYVDCRTQIWQFIKQLAAFCGNTSIANTCKCTF